MTEPTRDLTWTPHYRVAWGGSIGTPALEQWSNSVRVRYTDVLGIGAGVLGHDDLQSVCDTLATVLTGWMLDASSHIGSDARLDYVKANWIGADGLQLDQNTVQTDVVPAVAGVGANGPWLISQVLTLRTALRRGRSHSGRIYPPVVSLGATSGSPYADVADVDDCSAAFARIIWAIQEAFNDQAPAPVGTTAQVIVASPGSTLRGTLPLFQPITGVVCDRVADVMHSRTHSVPRAEGSVIVPGP